VARTAKDRGVWHVRPRTGACDTYGQGQGRVTRTAKDKIHTGFWWDSLKTDTTWKTNAWMGIL